MKTTPASTPRRGRRTIAVTAVAIFGTLGLLAVTGGTASGLTPEQRYYELFFGEPSTKKSLAAAAAQDRVEVEAYGTCLAGAGIGNGPSYHDPQLTGNTDGGVRQCVTAAKAEFREVFDAVRPFVLEVMQAFEVEYGAAGAAGEAAFIQCMARDGFAVGGFDPDPASSPNELATYNRCSTGLVRAREAATKAARNKFEAKRRMAVFGAIRTAIA